MLNSPFGLLFVLLIVSQQLKEPAPAPIRFIFGLLCVAYGARAFYRHRQWRRVSARIVQAEMSSDAEYTYVALKISFPVDDLIHTTDLSISGGTDDDAQHYVGKDIEIAYSPGNPYFPKPVQRMTSVTGAVVAGVLGAVLITSAFLI